MNRTLASLAVLLWALPALAQPALFAPADGARQALAPRQADLLAHLERIPAVTEAHLVVADLDALGEAEVLFNPTAAAAVSLKRAHVEHRRDGSSYVYESDADDTFALLVKRGDLLTGTVRIDGRLYGVRPLTSGLHAVAHFDEDAFVDHAPEWAEVEARAAARWADRGALPPAEPAEPVRGGTTIQRVLVPYTPTAAAQVGDILGLVQLAIDETNQGYANSDIAHRLELAYTYETTQNESGSFSTDLARLANYSDGFFDEIPALREEYGADLVQLITGQNGSLCGQATTILAGDADDAFAVASQSCATGYYTFGHELGHLQGARHNPEADPTTTPFPYGHGKYYIPGGWRTVMSYACSGGSCTRVLQWSNPDVLYNGVATGDVTTRDNARVLDETAATIAGFYPDPPGSVAFNVTPTGSTTVPAAGGTVTFDVTISNTSGATVTSDVWVFVSGVNETPHDPFIPPITYTLSNGQSLTDPLEVTFPADAAPGAYTLTAYFGPSFPSGIDASDDGFAITKAASLTANVSGEAARGASDDGTAAPHAAAHATTEATTLLGTAPNPFSRQTTVRYALAEAGPARLAVYDLLGREVAVLADGPAEAGAHAAVLAAGALPSGVYVVRLAADGLVQTRRVTLLR